MRAAFGPIPSEFVSETEICDFKEPMAEALAKVNRLGGIVVTKDGSYYGVVDDRAITNKGIIKINQKFSIGKFARQAPVLTKDSDMKKAIFDFYSSYSKVLPYLENGKVKGMVLRTDVLKAILSMHLLSEFKSSDIMSTPVLAIDYETSIDKAKTAMRDNRVNRLVVLYKGKVYGILTGKNFVEYGMMMRSKAPAFGTGEKRHTKVGEVCQKGVYTIEYGDGVENAIRDYINKGISSLLVIRNGKPAGMLTIRDVLETIVKNANVPQRNIVLSGLDESLREYEGEIRAELESFADKVDRFHNTKVDYIAMTIKKVKSKEYEIRARLGLSRGGVIHIYTYGYSLESTLRDLLKKMFREAKGRNDVIIANRKV